MNLSQATELCHELLYRSENSNFDSSNFLQIFDLIY